MWVSPRHPDRDRLLSRADGNPSNDATGSPPEPYGELLASWHRRGDDGGDTELRLTRETFKGRPSLGLRVWRLGPGGAWPTKRGVSIRYSELERLVLALSAELKEQRGANGRTQASPNLDKPGKGRSAPSHPPAPQGPPDEDAGY